MPRAFTTSRLFFAGLLAALESVAQAAFAPFDASALSAVNSWQATGSK